MRSFYRWVFEHSGLCRLLLLMALGAFSFYAATFPYTDFLVIYLIDLAIWFLAGRFIASAPFKLLEEPNRHLNENCDPYPMLEELRSMLDRNMVGPQHQLLEINYALCLRETGEYHHAAEILENLNIDKFPATDPLSKYTYYHNLCDIQYLLGNDAEARIWARKFRQIYQDIPMTKAKQALTCIHDLMDAEILYYEGNFEHALRKVAWIKLENKRMVVDGAMLAAKCHIALEEPEKAKEKLQYVLDNGNKLHVAQEASQLLESLN